MSNTSILSELKPCGYVLATCQYKYFALKCLYCDKKYGHWATFLQHLRELHVEVVDETQCLIDCTEETSESGMPNKELTSDEFIADVEIGDNSISSSVCEFDEGVNEMEGLTEHKTEEGINAEDTDSLLAAHFDTECPATELISNDLNDSIANVIHCSEIHNAAALPEYDTKEINIDFKIENSNTLQFIKIYENFPTLWPNGGVGDNANKRQYDSKIEMLRSLSEHNIIISTVALEDSILKLQQQYSDIASRLEEGIEISDIEEQYLIACSYLKPFEKNRFEMSLIGNETESEDSSFDHSIYDKPSTYVDDIEGQLNSFVLIDDGLDKPPDRNQKHSLVKFSKRNNITCDFIQCFRDQFCLWHPQDPAYNDIKERMKAINNIKELFSNNYNLQLTERKINSEIKRLYIFYKRCISSRRNLKPIRKYYYERCDFLANAELDNMQLISSNAYRKISFSVIDEFTLGFIDLSAMHPVLWDKNHPNYSVLNIRKEAYEKIATNLSQIYDVTFSNDELYYAISRLKQQYYGLQRKRILEGSLTKDEHDFLERCSFLPTSNSNLQCHICERILRSHSTLQTHLLKVHNIGELPHKCDYCEQRFAQRNVKKEHEVRAHTKEFEWFCPYCAKGFANRRDMEMHQMVHTGEQKVICEHCGKGFRLKHQMTEHVKIMHERLRRFKCTMCPKDFLRKRELDDHIRTHLNIRDKICNICGKGFTNTHGLFRHKQLHSDVKRYECKACGERFRRISGLSAHKKRKHQIIKQQENSSNVFMEEEKEEANEISV